MGDRRHIGDAADFETHGMQTTHGGIAPRARALHEHFDVLHAEFVSNLAGLVGGGLGGGGRALARALDAAGPGGYGHWYAYAARAPAGRGGDAGRDSCRDPSDV